MIKTDYCLPKIQPDYLRVESVSYSFAEREVLRDFSLTVREHETIGLIGPSGCGKTTLLNLIGGLLIPNHGQIQLKQKDSSTGFKDITGSRRFCSYMFQDHTLLPWRSVLNNILLPTEVDGIENTPKAQAQAHKLLEIFGLSDSKKLYPHQLSGGMRQRVAFARTFMVERPLYLFDEPFTGVDFVRQLKLERMLSSFLLERQKNCIMISHDIEAALALSHRLIIMGGAPAQIIKIFETGLGKHWEDPVDARESRAFGETLSAVVESLRSFLTE
jgi:NitT/TauT family transport system ATP-binding protein